jgi:serine/threonine protein kinase
VDQDALTELYRRLVDLDEYRPVELVDQSTFGLVLRVEELSTGESRILKVSPDSSVALHACQRLEREAMALGRFQHPHIVHLHGLREVPVGPCLVLEDLGDETLDELSQEVDPLGLLLQIAEALEVLHADGLVHRDVKPANIVKAAGDRAVLIDFGGCFHPDMTQWTAPGHLVGTLPYVAPEIYRGGLVTAAADWFSWGVCLFSLLEGRLPFEPGPYEEEVPGGSLPPVVFQKIVYPGPVADLIQACLSWDPRKRPGSSQELRNILEAPEGWIRRFRRMLGI